MGSGTGKKAVATHHVADWHRGQEAARTTARGGVFGISAMSSSVSAMGESGSVIIH
jgi:hypothetical protein